MPSILRSHHVLAVPDKEVSASFYVDVLGFREVHRDDGWVFVERDGCRMMLGECPDAIPPTDLGDHGYFAYLVVDDARAWHDALVARGVELVMPLGDRPWGMRELGIRTADGHRLMLGEPIE